jgi:hypothetical protein
MFRSLCAIAALCAALDARADYLFTWHYIYPQFQKFQGSFELTDAEMQPGATFNSDLFRTSISITSPEGITYRGNDPNWSDAYGSLAPNPNLFMTLHDSSHSITLDVFANGPTFEGDLYEFFLGGTTITEHGWWTYQQIPEPSVSALVAIAAVIWIVNRRR